MSQKQRRRMRMHCQMKGEAESISIYWQSTDAAKLFGCSLADDVFDCVKKHADLLISVIRYSDAYKGVVIGGGST